MNHSLQFVPTNWITWFSPRTLTPFETHVLNVIRAGNRVNFPTIINALTNQCVRFPSCYPANLSVLGALSYLTVSGFVIEHDDYTYSATPPTEHSPLATNHSSQEINHAR